MEIIFDVLETDGVYYIEYNNKMYALPVVSIGVEDYKMALQYVKKKRIATPYRHSNIEAFCNGYASAKPKKYTEEDLRKAFEFGCLTKFNSPLIKKIDLNEKFNAFLQTVAPKPKQVEVEMVDEVVAGSKTGLPFFSEPGKEVPRYSGLGRWVPTVDEKGFVKVLRWIY